MNLIEFYPLIITVLTAWGLRSTYVVTVLVVQLMTFSFLKWFLQGKQISQRTVNSSLVYYENRSFNKDSIVW